MTRDSETEYNYNLSIPLLLEIHDLIAKGSGSSERAAEIRNNLELLAEDLSDQLQSRLQRLSADLYTLWKPESGTALTGNRADLIKYWDNRNWDAFLHYLAANNGLFDSEKLAWFRAKAWEELAGHQVSLLFYLKASHYSPGRFINEGGVLRALEALRRNDLLLNRAFQILELPKAEPQLVVYAVALAVTNLIRLKQIKSATWEHLLGSLEKALPGLDSQDSQIKVSALLCIGACKSELGDFDGAVGAYNDALNVAPQSLETRAARGLLYLKTDFTRAVEDFHFIVQNGGRFPLAYFVETYRAFANQEYDNCIRLGETAVRLTSDPVLLPQLFTWIAISQFQVGKLIDDIAETIKKAQTSGLPRGDVEYNLRLLQSKLNQREQYEAWQVPDVESLHLIDHFSVMDNVPMPALS